MAEFAYDAINAQGVLTSGTLSAPDFEARVSSCKLEACWPQ